METSLYTPFEDRTRRTFMALMNSLSFPGRAHELPLEHDVSVTSSIAAIAETLLDLETSFFAPEQPLHEYLLRSGAVATAADTAAYHFYSRLHAGILDEVNRASAGTMLYPDSGATIIAGAKLHRGTRFRLRGPGIKDTQTLHIDDVAAEFWALRQAALRYPLGWDVFLIDGNQIVGIPRTTQLSIEEA